MIDQNALQKIKDLYPAKYQENVLLSNFTTMRVGGPADILLTAHSAEMLARMVADTWTHNLPLYLLGSGSNLLISDKGLRGIVIINRAHNIKVKSTADGHTVWAESGALMVNVGKKLIMRGLSGMEWAGTIPGTVGGAVYGNAGAFGKDTCHNLISADIIHRESGREEWTCDRLDFEYRSSVLKRNDEEAVILSALFSVDSGVSEDIKNEIDGYRKRRSKIQPPGPSVGSVFRNPPGNSAGRLIEQAGLKGYNLGGAVISEKHANFIINEGGGSAKDVFDLIMVAKKAVKEKFDIDLIPEIEVLGEWENLPPALQKKRRTTENHQ